VTIQRNWQELIKPTKLEFVSSGDNARVASVVAEPLERGYGLTLGNALRRVLLSSLQGAAVTAIQIDGILHEFSSLPGVREDMTDLVLNVKEIALKMGGEGPKRLTLNKQGPGAVVAGDIKTTGDIEVLNPELVICHLDDGAEINIEFTVNTGKGYVSADKNRPEDAPIGYIPVDSLFSPVRRVSYKVDATRAGESLDKDKLTLTVETNGAITPEDAVAYAARILQDQLSVFVNFEEPTKEKAQDTVPIDITGKSPIGDYMVVASGRSNRHVAAIAERLLVDLKDAGIRDVRVEGMPNADWVLIDAGDVIVHLFRPEVRSFYNIEKIWSVETGGHRAAV